MTPRDVMPERSSAESVDDQIAHLLETIEAEAPSRPELEDEDSAPERAPAGAGRSPRPRLIVTPAGELLPARVLRRFSRRWREVRSDFAYIVLAGAVGLLIGLLLGR
jgi:hypothetical protein